MFTDVWFALMLIICGSFLFLISILLISKTYVCTFPSFSEMIFWRFLIREYEWFQISCLPWWVTNDLKFLAVFGNGRQRSQILRRSSVKKRFRAEASLECGPTFPHPDLYIQSVLYRRCLFKTRVPKRPSQRELRRELNDPADGSGVKQWRRPKKHPKSDGAAGFLKRKNL